jgi:hypothetical protein
MRQGRCCWHVHVFTRSRCHHRRVILLIAFLFAMSMVLLNLLIALMSDAASKVSLQLPVSRFRSRVREHAKESTCGRLFAGLSAAASCRPGAMLVQTLLCCGLQAALHYGSES